MNEIRNVAVLVEQSNSYARDLLAGVLRFVRQHAWSVYIPEHDPSLLNQTWIRDWNGDGMIARVEADWLAREIRQSDVPLVDLSGSGRGSPRSSRPSSVCFRLLTAGPHKP